MRNIDDAVEESKMKQNFSLALRIEDIVSHLSCHSVRHRREGHGHSDKRKKKKD
jgi:hypothetical protein